MFVKPGAIKTKVLANRFKNLDLLEPHNLVPPGVFTLDGIMRYGEEHKQCPYFSARRMVRYNL